MSNETRAFVIKTLSQSNKSGAETVRRLRILLGMDAAPIVSSICWLIKNLNNLVQLLISKAPVRLGRPCETRQRELRGSYY